MEWWEIPKQSLSILKFAGIILGLIKSDEQHLKDQILKEIHKVLSQGKKYRLACEIRDKIWKQKHHDKTITLEFTLLFDRMIRELEMENIIYIFEKEQIKFRSGYYPDSYISEYTDRIKQYGISETQHYVTIRRRTYHPLHDSAIIDF